MKPIDCYCLPDFDDEQDSVEVESCKLVEAFRSLTPKQAYVIARIYYDGAGVREAAKECGVSHVAVMDRRDGALRKLERILKEVDDNE